MSDADDDLFRSAMGDVKPITFKRKVVLTRNDDAALAAEARRRAAAEEPLADGSSLSGDFIHPLHPHDILDFKRPGVQNGVYRNLRLGKYSIDARLDLHRLSVEQARDSVSQFIRECLEQDIRCAMITHGKGVGREQPALLKSCVAHWLPQLDAVLAFHSAQQHHGGSGATYVLLKKSERKRQENFERHQKKR